MNGRIRVGEIADAIDGTRLQDLKSDLKAARIASP
jgi:hypothetical protein